MVGLGASGRDGWSQRQRQRWLAAAPATEVVGRDGKGGRDWAPLPAPATMAAFAPVALSVNFSFLYSALHNLFTTSEKCNIQEVCFLPMNGDRNERTKSIILSFW